MNTCDSFFDRDIFKFLDFSSNFTESLFANSHDFGDFHGCLKFNTEDFQGKYCSVQYRSTSPNVTFVPPAYNQFNYGWKDVDKRFSGAICIPSICDEKNFVPKLMAKLFNGTNLVMATDYNQSDYCQIENSFKLTRDGIFGISILTILTILMILGIFSSNIFLSAFSIKRNFLGLIKPPKDESLKYLRGLRGFIFIVTIYTHIQATKYYSPFKDARNLIELRTGINFMKYTAFTAPTGISVFIIISTILTTRMTIELMRKNRLNIPLMYIYRYIRIASVLLFFLGMEKLFIEGFIYKTFQSPLRREKIWDSGFPTFWLPLTFVQNYVDKTFRNLMFPPLYYLAIDFQFFIITPPLVYVLMKFKKFGIFLLSAIFIGSCLSVYLFIKNNFEYFLNLDFFDYLGEPFVKFSQCSHFLAYAMSFGIALGYMTKLDLTLKLNSYFNILPFLILTLAYIKLIAWSEIKSWRQFSPFLFTANRIDYVLIVGAFFLMFHYGNSQGMINFLSTKFWTCIEKLGLSIYFAHSFAICHFYINITKPVDEISEWIIITKLYTYTMLLAILLHLMVERPVTNIINGVIFGRKTEHKSEIPMNDRDSNLLAK